MGVEVVLILSKMCVDLAELRKNLFVLVRTHAHNEVLATDATTHIAVHKKRQPNEHLLLCHTASNRESG